ncbi:MAG TPA: RHS repeat-associated core domain-containing protein, partial [Panacibacter sp.]|nr:RHS repeat-associated core domain-containing protein [Panacibacter sp.]
PFGMQMPGRTYQAGNYRYGFNGKENDNEVKGTGNQQDYGMRIYDLRAGRFLSVDPLVKEYPELTPYQFASNTPMQAIDRDGLEKVYYMQRSESHNAVELVGNLPGNIIAGAWNTLAGGWNKLVDYGRAITNTGDPIAGFNEQASKDLKSIATGVTNVFTTRASTDDFLNQLSSWDSWSQAIENDALFYIGGKKLKTALKIETKVATAVKTTEQVENASAKATAFMRTETIGGNKAARTVGANIKIIKDGGSLAPIEVANINDKLYVINGHHRLEAALRTNTNIEYKVLTKEQWQAYGYKTESEIIRAASEASVEKIKLDKKVIQQAAGQTQ